MNNYELFEPNDIRASISGKFDIVIDLSESNTYRNVYEVGDKIINIADKLNIELSDLHAMKKEGNSNSVNVCIAGYLEEDHKIAFLEFFCESVVPYFCDLVIFEQKGYWQCGGYSHGVAGLLENYTTLLKDSDEMELTIKCLKELPTPSMAFNFAPALVHQ